MLIIQRASAGSGKTFTLTKKFIINLLVFKTGDDNWKLRNYRQIEEALSHILAITFTNKATNEMKQRIINNLSLIARASEDNVSPETLEQTPYIKEIHDLTKRNYKDIGETAVMALKVILNNYSQFKISTIDSFFQEILRTFTYEANINEGYQLEIDSAVISDAAIDEAINQLDSDPARMGNAAFWLRILMKEQSKKNQRWNPFNKKISGNSIYSKIRNAISELDKENFKEIKEKLDDFFELPQSRSMLIDAFVALRDKGISEKLTLLKDIKGLVSQAKEIINTNNLSEVQLSKHFLTHLNILENLKFDDKFENSYSLILKDQSVFKKKFRIEGHPLDVVALQLYHLVEIWKNPGALPRFKRWLIYGPLIPYLGLILEVRTFITYVLESNNIIKLSDTGYILKKIISGEDAPFVFERLGNNIDHYLIDEFQDTSRMQWDVIYPLLNEGLAKDKESLIIGDPKQSIYRFRNADHKLITEVVPRIFANHHEAGFSKEENTNWRSHTNIVKFNNFLFKTLAQALTVLSGEKGGATDFNNLYGNVVQFPHNTEGKGYVEIRILKKPENPEIIDFTPEYEEEEGFDNWFEALSLYNLNTLVSSLIKRGYKQKDIGILVNKNSQGKKIIDSLIRYNSKLPDDMPKIDFISEESLLVSSSPAVAVILGVIEKLSRPFVNLKCQSGEEKKTIYYNWNDIRVDYAIYANRYPDLSPAERMMKFLSEANFEDAIDNLLKDLQATTITSIVEATVKFMLDPLLRKSDAIYITSFQDIVNEYSASHSLDPASFIEWWNNKGKNISISTPEGLDAVQIMTVHKSKGLEFKCVIIPFANETFLPSHFSNEWRWVYPEESPDLNLPCVLPVQTTPTLLGSVHESQYLEYVDQVITDKLNTLYVAFTRARNELYLFTKEESGNKNNTLYYYLNQILRGIIFPIEKSGEEIEDKELLMMNSESIMINEKEDIFSFGSEFSNMEILAEYEKERLKKVKDKESEQHKFRDYFVNNKRPALRSLASKINQSGISQ